MAGRQLLVIVLCEFILQCQTFPDMSNEVDISRSPPDIYGTDEYFKQRLDHFTTTDERTWNQRYWMHKPSPYEGNLVFLSVGAEWTMSESGLYDGTWEEFASRYNGTQFQLEHRFYGESHPTSDMSDANLKYLTTQQAVGDIAYFILSMNKKHQFPKGTRWIVIGCSCSGTLAAWVRYKYPHLVYGAIATSAPILLKVNFPEYLNYARESLRTYGEDCPTAFQAVFQEIDNLLLSPNGSQIISERLNLCSPLDVNNTNDVTNLYEKLANDIMYIVQNNNPSWSNDWPINGACEMMTNTTTNPLKTFARVMRSYGTFVRCIDHSYDNRIKGLRDSKWSRQTDRQYIYQMCSELGYFQTAETDDSFLGSRLPMSFYYQLCSDAYGKQFTKEFMEKSISHTNMMYGGLDIAATRVIYIHHSFDPWQTLGNNKTRISESPVIYINGASHCAFNYREAYSDPPGLKAARQQVSDIIGEWSK